eukprot:14518855-Alexandrium_andersonii.AAC.1
MAFAKFTLGLLGCEAVLSSGIVSGVAWRLSERKRALRQRPPFTVAAARTLQSLARPAPDPVDAVLAGYVAFCIATRTRDADAQKVAAEPELDLALDGMSGFVEAKGAAPRRATPRSGGAVACLFIASVSTGQLADRSAAPWPW